jgi:hypothetical protein
LNFFSYSSESKELEVKNQLDNYSADLKSHLASLLLDKDEPELPRIRILLQQALDTYESSKDKLKIGECFVSLGMVVELQTGDGSVEYESACAMFEKIGVEELPEQFREFLVEYREAGAEDEE